MYLVILTSLFYVVGGQDYDVLILGAGASGLSAAKTFFENDVTNFLVLEANDYIGGRMKNQKFGNASVALGAGWIHLPETNHSLYQIAKRYNMDWRFDAINDTIFKNGENGSEYTSDAVNARTYALGQYVAWMNQLLAAVRPGKEGDMDLRAGLRWAGWNPKTQLDEAVEYLSFDFLMGIEPDKLAAYGNTLTDEESQNYLITDDRGYSFGVVEDAAPYKDKILLNQEVVKVQKMNDMFHVHVKNGTTYTARYVLVTFSSGVLNARVVQFEPDLPQWKYAALTLAPMNHFCKIFLSFNESFWDNNDYMFAVPKLRGWYMIWQNLYKFFGEKGKNMLMSTLAGDRCIDSLRKTDDEVKIETYEVLKKVYSNATMPTAILRNDWSINKLFYGGYSTRRAGITVRDVSALAHPVNKSLWFTGEYTHPEVHGYAHSAYEMGQHIAGRMIQCMRNQNMCPSDPTGTPASSTTARPTSSTLEAGPTTSTSQSPPCSKDSKIIGSFLITLSGITVSMLLVSHKFTF